MRCVRWEGVLFAGLDAPYEWQPDGLAAPVGVDLAVEELVAVVGSFAVGDGAVACGRAPAHGWSVCSVGVPAVRRSCHRRRFNVPNGLDPAARLSFLAARRSLGVLAGFLLVRLRGDLSAIVGPLGVVAVGVGVDADEEIEHLADGAFLADGVA